MFNREKRKENVWAVIKPHRCHRCGCGEQAEMSASRRPEASRFHSAHATRFRSHTPSPLYSQRSLGNPVLKLTELHDETYYHVPSVSKRHRTLNTQPMGNGKGMKESLAQNKSRGARCKVCKKMAAYERPLKKKTARRSDF